MHTARESGWQLYPQTWVSFSLALVLAARALTAGGRAQARAVAVGSVTYLVVLSGYLVWTAVVVPYDDTSVTAFTFRSLVMALLVLAGVVVAQRRRLSGSSLADLPAP